MKAELAVAGLVVALVLGKNVKRATDTGDPMKLDSAIGAFKLHPDGAHIHRPAQKMAGTKKNKKS